MFAKKSNWTFVYTLWWMDWKLPKAKINEKKKISENYGFLLIAVANSSNVKMIKSQQIQMKRHTYFPIYVPFNIEHSDGKQETHTSTQ